MAVFKRSHALLSLFCYDLLVFKEGFELRRAGKAWPGTCSLANHACRAGATCPRWGAERLEDPPTPVHRAAAGDPKIRLMI